MVVHSTLSRARGILAVSLIAATVAHASAADKIAKEPGFIYIASFNIHILGAVEQRYRDMTEDGDLNKLNDDIPERIANLARVLAVGNFDLIAIQEIKAGYAGHAAMSDLVRTLKAQHNLDYNYLLSEGIGRGYMISEATAFLYNPRIVQPEKIDGMGVNLICIEIPGRNLIRTQWEANHFDFTMYAAHLAWGNHDDRRAGYKVIAEIFEQPEKRSEDPDIIVLGDFNRLGNISQQCAKGADNCKEQPPIKALKYDVQSPEFRAPSITAFDRAFSLCPEVDDCKNSGTTLPVSDLQLLSTTVADNTFAYDMIMFSRDADEEFPENLNKAQYGVDFGIIHFDHPGGFGFQPGAEKLNHKEIKQAYSDHRPVWIRFRTSESSFADD